MSISKLNAYQIQDLELTQLTLDEMKHALSIVTKEQTELSNEYHRGGYFSYPPDWYDSYVYPLDRLIAKSMKQNAQQNNTTGTFDTLDAAREYFKSLDGFDFPTVFLLYNRDNENYQVFTEQQYCSIENHDLYEILDILN